MALSRVLIANRGEIAVRVIKACFDEGIESVLAVSEADKGSLGAQLADRVVVIGPAAAAESYLDIDRVVAAAKVTECDGLHPGYGFLSERAELSAPVFSVTTAIGLALVALGAFIYFIDHITKAIRVNNLTPYPEGDEEQGVPLDDVLIDDRRKSPDDQLIESDDLERIMSQLNLLEEREAAVIRMRFGLDADAPMTLREVGEQLHLTRERVRQLENQALAKLMANFNSDRDDD